MSALEIDCRRAFFDDDGRLCTEITVRNRGPEPRELQEITLARSLHGLGPRDAPLATVPQINVSLGAGDLWEGTFRWSLEVSRRVRADRGASILVGWSDGRTDGAEPAAAPLSLAGSSTNVEPTVIRLRRGYRLQVLGAIFSLAGSAFMFREAAGDDGGSVFAGVAYLAFASWLGTSAVKRWRSDRPRLVLGPDWLVIPERRRAIGSPPGEVLIPFDAILSLEARPETTPSRLVVHTRDGKNPFLLAKELPAAWPLRAVLEAIEERRRQAAPPPLV
jgi:hypothetical protein